MMLIMKEGMGEAGMMRWNGVVLTDGEDLRMSLPEALRMLTLLITM